MVNSRREPFDLIRTLVHRSTAAPSVADIDDWLALCRGAVPAADFNGPTTLSNKGRAALLANVDPFLAGLERLALLKSRKDRQTVTHAQQSADALIATDVDTSDPTALAAETEEDGSEEAVENSSNFDASATDKTMNSNRETSDLHDAVTASSRSETHVHSDKPLSKSEDNSEDLNADTHSSRGPFIVQPMSANSAAADALAAQVSSDEEALKRPEDNVQSY
jgi:hypothetical protein